MAALQPSQQHALADRGQHGAHGDWVKKHGVEADRRRIRTTFESARDRQAWHGSPRSLIDPNHSPRTEADHYLTAATPAQQDAVEGIIEQAQGDMARRAQPPRVVTAEQLAELAGQLPETIAALGLDEPAAAELVSGGQDVFTAACTDPASGLHGPPGKPCPARPWVCLLCPLAIFAPRHAGNLLRLKAWFSRQWAGMPTAQFMATFGPYATRLDEILQHYPAPLLAAAAAASTTTTTPCRSGPRRAPHDPTRPRRPPRRRRRPPVPVHRIGCVRRRRAAARPRRAHRHVRPGRVALRRRRRPGRLPAMRDTRLDFTTITDRRWQLVAKEYIYARLAPADPVVAVLPGAYRVPLTLQSCGKRLIEAATWLNWLTGQQITSLGQVTQDHCDRYLIERGRRKDASGTVIGTLEDASLRVPAAVVIDLAGYGELFTADHYAGGFTPWRGRTSSQVAGVRSGGENKTPPLDQQILQPLLAAAFYLTATLGPHVVALRQRVRQHRLARRKAPLHQGHPR